MPHIKMYEQRHGEVVLGSRTQSRQHSHPGETWPRPEAEEDKKFPLRNRSSSTSATKPSTGPRQRICPAQRCRDKTRDMSSFIMEKAQSPRWRTTSCRQSINVGNKDQHWAYPKNLSSPEVSWQNLGHVKFHYGEGAIPKIEDHLLSAVRDCSFNHTQVHSTSGARNLRMR